MKRLGLVAIALLVLLTLCGSNVNATASVGTWHTYREDISCASGYADIDYTDWYNASTNRSGVTAINFTLPCALSALSGADTEFTIYPYAPGAWYNLTVNGVLVNNSDELTVSTENQTTLTSIIAAGVANTDEYLNFSFDCNATTTSIGINITGTDVAFSTTWLTAILTIKEKDVTRLPYVGTSSTNSIHAVNDSFNISSTTLWFPITGVYFNLTFPSHVTTTPITTFEAPTLSNNGSYQNYTQYQKYGPYVYSVDEEVDGTTHEVTIKIKSNEVLTNCVQWDLDPIDSVYDGVFDELNADTLDIEYNSANFDDWDWDADDEILTFEDFTTREGYSNNKFIFTWTEATAETPAEPEESIWDWFTGDISGIPVWVIIVVAVVIVILVGYVYTHPKKRK